MCVWVWVVPSVQECSQSAGAYDFIFHSHTVPRKKGSSTPFVACLLASRIYPCSYWIPSPFSLTLLSPIRRAIECKMYLRISSKEGSKQPGLVRGELRRIGKTADNWWIPACFSWFLPIGLMGLSIIFLVFVPPTRKKNDQEGIGQWEDASWWDQ